MSIAYYDQASVICGLTCGVVIVIGTYGWEYIAKWKAKRDYDAHVKRDYEDGRKFCREELAAKTPVHVITDIWNPESTFWFAEGVRDELAAHMLARPFGSDPQTRTGDYIRGLEWAEDMINRGKEDEISVYCDGAIDGNDFEAGAKARLHQRRLQHE